MLLSCALYLLALKIYWKGKETKKVKNIYDCQDDCYKRKVSMAVSDLANNVEKIAVNFSIISAQKQKFRL